MSPDDCFPLTPFDTAAMATEVLGWRRRFFLGLVCASVLAPRLCLRLVVCGLRLGFHHVGGALVLTLTLSLALAPWRASHKPRPRALRRLHDAVLVTSPNTALPRCAASACTWYLV